MNITQILTILGTGGALGAAIGSIIQWLTNRRKLSADAASVISRTAIELLDPMRAELDAARGEIRTLRHRISELSDELDATRRQLRSMTGE